MGIKASIKSLKPMAMAAKAGVKKPMAAIGIATIL
jgi:hypothetical protein